MSKIEAGKLTLNPIDYDFYALADNIKSMFKFVSQKKGIDFKFECEKTVPNYLFGDDIRLRQILTNICGNAVKFTEKGHVKLKIFKDGDWLVLAISDTGMGIRKEDIPKLFSAFAQADAMKNRGITGTGLGLSICKSFVEMMGGKITIDSEYGQGTVFTITIPIVPGNQENVKLASEKREQKLEAPNAKLLLVDDNEINIKVASGLLGLLKITPKTAFSGREAVEMVQQEQFDIVLMDHMMPEMDGIEATSIIRNLGEKYEELPIIALTANAIQGAKQMFLSNGFSGFLSKPINVQELNETLITWLPPEKVNKIDGAAKPAIPEAEEVEPEVSFLDAIRKIPEINVEIGMERFSNVEDMYHETFELFYKELRGKCDSMFTFLSNQDIHAFAISVHAMKSALATMGIMDLSETASKLETASKNDEMDFCLEHFPNFMDKLLSLHKNLSTILSDTETASEKKPGDKAYLNENIEKALIAANDFDNYAGMEAINNLLSCDFGEEINAPLEDALKSFNELDFDTVVEILNKVNIHIQP
jgi:CheY-like chemotaxis protein